MENERAGVQPAESQTRLVAFFLMGGGVANQLAAKSNRFAAD
jgi:hypothetical protein